VEGTEPEAEQHVMARKAKAQGRRNELVTRQWSTIGVPFLTPGTEQWGAGWTTLLLHATQAFQGNIYTMGQSAFSGEVSVFQIDPPETDSSGSFRELTLPWLIATFQVPGYCFLVECDSWWPQKILAARLLILLFIYRLTDLDKGQGCAGDLRRWQRRIPLQQQGSECQGFTYHCGGAPLCFSI
jgi:hypothetical protein